MQTKSIFRLSVLPARWRCPGAVQALGLGKLTVESYVGQPLVRPHRVHCPASKEELDTLSAKVADPSLYRRTTSQYRAGAVARRVLRSSVAPTIPRI